MLINFKPSRALKSSEHRPSVQVITPAAQELKGEDIIPGRLTRAQWTDMLLQEDADEAVGEILDELLSKVMKGCLDVYTERQLPAFSASWAKSYLTQIVEHQILCLDEGEGPEGSKTEDSEPMPAIPDAWAQGCVPVLIRQPHLASQQVFFSVSSECLQFKLQREARVSQQCNVKVQTNSSLKQTETETSPRRPVSDKHCEVLSPRSPPKNEQKKKQHDSLLPKYVPGKLLPPLPCSTEKMEVRVENKNLEHSVYNHVTGLLHQRKNFQAIPKFDPSCLPRYSSVPQFGILDNNHTKLSSKKPSGLPKVEPKYNKQQTKQTVTLLEPLNNSKDQWTKFHRKEPLRLDTVVLAKSVSLLDPKEVEMKPARFNLSQSTNLRLIQSDVSVPVFSVDQVAAGPPPQVTPLLQPKNCDS
uniref:Uncharacterized protein n=1 Tax=Amphilophus citrinellus TaxID=61819 RepID=A0A3Q0SN34_AMPCI